jgi:hypothetical protein
MIEELVDELAGSTDSQLDDRVRSIELERRRLDAELAATLAEIDRRTSYLDDGHRTFTAYLRATCNWSDVEAKRMGRLADAVMNVPGLVEALHVGRIGAPQAHEFAAAHANPRVRDRLVEFAPTLLDHAERLRFVEFRTCIRRFVVLADLDGAHRELDATIAGRRAQLVNLNGELCLTGGGGDPLVNAELEMTFRHFCELEYEADVAARRECHGDDAELHALPRTPSQRGYDALVAIVRHAAANLDAGRQPRAAEFLINVLVDHRTFAAMLTDAGLAADATSLAGEPLDPFTGVASPSALLADLVDGEEVTTRRCETSSGVILHPHAVLRAALAGHIRRVVLGADSVPINMGRKARVFAGPARDAALLLAVRCDHPGCGLPADWCQVDHSTEWHQLGRTDQTNAGVECSGHNREKHRKRWRTRRDVTGRVHTIRADGTIILPIGVRPPTFPAKANDSDDADADSTANPPDDADGRAYRGAPASQRSPRKSTECNTSPVGGATWPAALRSSAASVASVDSTDRLPRPTSTSVPTMLRTIW